MSLEDRYSETIKDLHVDRRCLECAILNDLALLKCAVEKGNPLSKGVYWFAVKNRNMEMVKWLYEKRCPWDRKTTEIASHIGDVEILSFLIENRCPINDRVVTIAVKNGNIGSLSYLFLVYECPILCKEDLYITASRYDQVDVIRWIIVNDQVFHFDPFTCYFIAVRNGSLKVIIFLYDQFAAYRKKYIMKEAMSEAVYHGRLDVLKWIYQYNEIIPIDVWKTAIYNDNLGILEWMLQQGSPPQEIILFRSFYKISASSLEMIWDAYPSFFKEIETELLENLKTQCEIGFLYRYVKRHPEAGKGLKVRNELDGLKAELGHSFLPELMDVVFGY